MTQIKRYPLTRHTMASEMPVLPLVGSMTVQPGRSSPSASALATIASAGRSLIDPVGFRSSSLAHNRTFGEGDSRGRPTRGVPPTASIRLLYRATKDQTPATGTDPPATAGRIVTLSPSATVVSRPPVNRTSSSLT